ncbi:hypothetical protein ACIBG8_21565 [Nonomuraea sp. NPDC050556]|uniref:hypothetical protein n=1 Tax=Nonomuraea sp. NPDC050556 TaxID=3364369 RepID=UPI003793C2E6
MGKRQFDGKRFEGDAEVWYEAKSGSFWDRLTNIPKEMARFKDKMGEAVKYARENNAKFEIISEKPIPEEIKKWLTKKGINRRIEPRTATTPKGPAGVTAV